MSHSTQAWHLYCCESGLLSISSSVGRVVIIVHGSFKDYTFKWLVIVQSLSCVWLFATPWTSQAPLSFIISWSFFRPISIELEMPSNYLILCHHLLLLSSIFPSIRVFSNESALRIRRPKYWSSSFSISPSSEYSGLISFRIDWFDLLAVQGTLKSLLQYHNSKAFGAQPFFMVQLSNLYMTTRKTIALTMWTFVGTVNRTMFYLFNQGVVMVVV